MSLLARSESRKAERFTTLVLDIPQVAAAETPGAWEEFVPCFYSPRDIQIDNAWADEDDFYSTIPLSSSMPSMSEFLKQAHSPTVTVMEEEASDADSVGHSANSSLCSPLTPTSDLHSEDCCGALGFTDPQTPTLPECSSADDELVALAAPKQLKGKYQVQQEGTCDHRAQWHRIRSKRNLNYWTCMECGACWCVPKKRQANKPCL